MEYIKPMIRFDQYEKLVDDIFILGRNAILRFNVVLNKYSDKYGRKSFHQEFEYFNREAHMNTVTLRRDFDFYLSIENIRSEDDSPIKQFIMITINDILGFNLFIEDVIKWFEDKKFDGLYAVKDNNLVMTKAISPIRIDLPPGNSYIMAEPMICVGRYNDRSPGVRLYLSSESNYTEVSLSKLKGLQYLVSRIDMYGCACSLINYLQRPELGTNIISYSTYKQEPSVDLPKSPVEGRKVQNQRPTTLEDLGNA